MADVVTAVYNDANAAMDAVDRLLSEGFVAEQVSVLTSESTDRNAFAVRTKSKIGEGAAIGAGTGGAIAALVAGITSVGAIATGGVGLLAAGPIVAALAGAGAGAAAGGTIGALIGYGIPEHEANFYQDQIKKGGVLIGVRATGDEAERAREILREYDPETVSSA